jgi:hypothetical protein
MRGVFGLLPARYKALRRMEGMGNGLEVRRQGSELFYNDIFYLEEELN